MENVWVKLGDRDGTLSHKRPASALLLVFERYISIHCHSADEKGVPDVSRPLMARGQKNRLRAHWKANF
jgi:hypothetical protein